MPSASVSLTTRRGSSVLRPRGQVRQVRPQDTGFVDFSRTNAGPSYHDRMVTHRFRGRLIVPVAVILALFMALACWLLSVSGVIGKSA